MHAEGCDFRKAVERLTDVRWRPLERGEAHLAATLAEVAQRVVTPQSEAEERAEAFACREREAIVRELRPLLDSPGERYFRETRNIDIETIADVLERTDAIGWHPSVRFHQPDPNKPLNEHHGKQFGCIVGVMTDAITAEPTGGISRTYITADSRKLCKAKSWGPVGITRLDGDAAVTYGLGLAEGLETTLSAMSRGFRPCWSIGGKSIMAAFPVLPAIESLTVFADNDPDGGGLRAAQEAQARWRAAGREARVRMTAKPGDLNDVRDRGAA
jgi:hypothetical protein